MQTKSIFYYLDQWWQQRTIAKVQASDSTPFRSRSDWRRTVKNALFTIFLTLITVMALLWAQNAGAFTLGATSVASTGTIAYQGRLANTAGQPLTGTYNMTFRLYAAAAGGPSLWEEQWTGANSVQVSDGLFNVMLGSVTPIAQNIVAGSSSLFLGITVGTDSEMSPRVQLGSVPFAVQALTVPNGSIATEKLANGAVTSSKQSATSYSLNDNTYVVALAGETKTISQFTLQDVPAGDMTMICTFSASTDTPHGVPGTIRLFANPGGDIDIMSTHVFDSISGDYTLHGRLQNLAGGNYTVQIQIEGQAGAYMVYFGVNNDARFGRKCTVVAGL